MNYPTGDPDTGLTVLPDGPQFNKSTIMPICLPPDENFKDNDRLAYAVGLGIKAEEDVEKRCFTDANGPDPFQQCSPYYINPLRNIDEDYGGTMYHCQKSLETPSALNPLCKKFYEGIHKLR